jgi:hypothetical protein
MFLSAVLSFVRRTGCSRDANKLEQLQLEAARIITGLPKFASKESVYFETGWDHFKL